MRTHTDVVTRAFQQLGVIRYNQAVPGDLFSPALASFEDMLETLHEDEALDFDPADASGVPEERMQHLVEMLVQSRVMAPFNENFDPTLTLYERARGQLYRGIFAPSDFVGDEARDY